MVIFSNLAQQYSLLTYSVIVFSLSWGTLLYYAGGWKAFPAKVPEETEAQMPAVIAATLLGPSIAGVVMTRWTGKYGLLPRFKQWRFPIWLYCQALLTVPILVMPLLLLLSRFNKDYLPDLVTSDKKLSLIIAGVSVGLVAGFFEETGWSGFAVPELLQCGYSEVTAGLLVGLVWGIWHFLVAYWGSGTSEGEFDSDLFIPWIPWNLMVLPAYRILMVRLYQKTNGSLLVMAVMHASLTANLPFILMPPCRGKTLSGFYLLFAMVLTLSYRVLAKQDKTEASRKLD